MVSPLPTALADIVAQGPIWSHGCWGRRCGGLLRRLLGILCAGGREAGIFLRFMTAPTLSFLLIRRGGDVEDRRAEQGRRAAHRTEAGECAAAPVGRAGRAGRGAQTACACGGGAARRRGRAA